MEKKDNQAYYIKAYAEIDKIYMEYRKLYHVACFWKMSEAFKNYSEWIAADMPQNRTIKFIKSDDYSSHNSDCIQEDYAAETINSLLHRNKLVYFDVDDETREKVNSQLTNLINLDNGVIQDSAGSKLPYIVRRNYKRVIDKDISDKRVELLKTKKDKECFIQASEILDFNFKSDEEHGSESSDAFSKLNKWIVLPKTSKVPKRVFYAIKCLYPWLENQNEDTEVAKLIDKDNLLTGNQFLQVRVQKPSLGEMLSYLEKSYESEKKDIKIGDNILDIVGIVDKLKKSQNPLELKDLYEVLKSHIYRRFMRLVYNIGTLESNYLFHSINEKYRIIFIEYVRYVNRIENNDLKNVGEEDPLDSGKYYDILTDSVLVTIQELMGSKGEKEKFSKFFPNNFKHQWYLKWKSSPEYDLEIENVKTMLETIAAENGIDVIKNAIDKLIISEASKNGDEKKKIKKTYWENVKEKLFDSKGGFSKKYKKLELTIKRLEKILNNVDVEKINIEKKNEYIKSVKKSRNPQNINDVTVAGGSSAEDEYLKQQEQTEKIADFIDEMSEVLNFLQKKENLKKQGLNDLDTLKLYLTYTLGKFIFSVENDILRDGFIGMIFLKFKGYMYKDMFNKLKDFYEENNRFATIGETHKLWEDFNYYKHNKGKEILNRISDC